MSKIIEFHVLQQFAPGNLNRDDTGAPKDAYFGGVRRGRISSQSFKRAIRRYFASARLLNDEELAYRTKRIMAALVAHLDGKVSDPQNTAKEILEQAIPKKKKDNKDNKDKQVVKKVKDAEHTEYLLFIGHKDVERLAEVAIKNKGDLTTKDAKAAFPGIMRSNRAVDVALFGRMLADAKDFNVDAAAQVAHAISTHRVEREFDFFTAVDDLAAGDEAVSGMLGTIDFNSACYYRYAVLHLDLLQGNLGSDSDLVQRAVSAFLTAYVRAIPSGKQNTFAAHNPPEFVAVRLRDDAPINLAGAFERAVSPKDGYIRGSVSALQSHWQQLDAAYGGAGSTWVLDLTGAWEGDTVATLDALRERLLATLG
jgi:CRISPR system Cascade subunit CasC